MHIIKPSYSESEGWSITLLRRYTLLRVFLMILAVACPVFAAVNYLHGGYLVASVELAVFFIAIWMLFYIRKPERLKRISIFFISISCFLGLFVSSLSEAHSTVAVWNALGPFFAFYLLGKRYGTIITLLYVPLSTGLYLLSHSSGNNAIPLVAVLNVVVFMLCISWIAYHFESTRAETEIALLDDIEARSKTEAELENTVAELKSAISEAKTLRGLLPICASCKKIRDDRGSWTQLESYIKKNSEADFSHSICPDCIKKHYPDFSSDI